MSGPEPLLHSESQITDVIDFFCLATKKYHNFLHNIVYFTTRIHVYSVQEISLKCAEIYRQRIDLAQLDNQLIVILELTGNQVFQTSMIQDYSSAVSEARAACDRLSRELLTIKLSLERGTDSLCQR